MVVDHFNGISWQEILKLLRERRLPDSLIGTAIVRLGKPFAERKINASKEVVASYITHPDSWIRHEVLWFLGSWGKLKEYRPVIIQAMKEDPFEDNRSYAANCLGVLDSGTKSQDDLKVLREIINNPDEKPDVRVTAYGALLRIFYGENSLERCYPYLEGDKNLDDIDWEWLKSATPE